MLRVLVLLLLLVNGVYLAWSQGLLRDWGLAPVAQSEPQRLRQQIKPEALRLLSADEARRVQASAEAVPPKPAECLQAGLFDEQQSAALLQALERSLPVGSWSLQDGVAPARWIVYMGKFANADLLARKKQELAQRELKFDALGNPALEPGLSLGGYDSEPAANEALKELTKKGVRTAHVVQERAELRGKMLRLPAVDETLRSRVDALKAQLGDKALASCKPS
jgi:hypothetical protein